MNEPGDIDPEELEALEKRVGAVMRAEGKSGSHEQSDRVAAVVARAQTDTVLKDTLAFTVAGMWATLAALLAPLFVAFARLDPPSNPVDPAPEHTHIDDDL